MKTNYLSILNGMKMMLLCTSFIALSYNGNAQITVKFKPNATIGQDAGLQTSYGCTPSGSSAPVETLNTGSSQDMAIYDWTFSSLGCSHGTSRALVKFTQLSTIPVGATIVSAKLNMSCVTSSAFWGTSSFPGSPYSTTNPSWVERVTSHWAEDTVTYATQPTTTTTNRVAVPVTTARWGWTTSIDVTALVGDIIASGSNEGFMLKLQTEAIYRSVLYSSSDNTDSTLWPELEITYLATPDPCAGTKADFKDTNSACYTFDFTDLSIAKDSGIVAWDWSFGDGSTASSKNPSHSYGGYGTYNVRLIVRDSSGCIDTFTKPVTVNYTHFANAGRDTIICLNGGTATAFLEGNKGSRAYSWTPAAGLSNASSSSTFATLSVPTIYYLTATDSFGCIDRDTVFVNLFAKANIAATPKDTSVCAGTFVQFTATGGLSYLWSPSTNLNFDNIANPYLKATTPATYVVKGTNANGCIGYDTVSVGIESSVIVTAQPKNIYGCADAKVQLSASGAEYYKWSPAEGLSADSIANPVATISQNRTYYVTGTSIAGCEGYDSVVVGMYPSPVVDAFSTENLIKCRGGSIRLNATGASRYEWSPAELCDDHKSSSPLVTPMNTTLFTVIGTNDNGCTATDTISVIFEGKAIAYIPNTFSPNNDGINDKFGVIDNCNFQFYSMRIFNRWGQNMFTTLSQYDKWDGNFNGKPADLGVYFYMIKGSDLDGKEVMQSGDFTLMR